ncbi:hypothetical protein Tco_1191609, partial [Tanacetum coccineum]
MANPTEIFDAKVSLRLKMHLLSAIKDEAPIVNEESIEIDDKSGGIDVHDPVVAFESNQLLDDVDSLFKEVIDVRPYLVGRVDELRTKLVQTLTSNVIPKETEVGNTSRPLTFDDSRKPNDSKGDENNYYYQESQPGLLQHLLNALEPELPPDIFFLQPNNVDEPHFDTIVKDNAEMEDNMDVDNEDGKYCLDDMSNGFEEYTSNGEIKVTLYQEDHKALCNKMDVAVEENTLVTRTTTVIETRVVDNTLKNKKVNLGQFIADVMYTVNMYVAIESHSSELYQIMNMSEEKLVKVNDRAYLKTGFRVVRRKKKPGVALQSP